MCAGHASDQLGRRDDLRIERQAHALALATDLGMRPLQAHCRLGLGKLYRRIHRVEDARVELSAAIGMLHDLEMALWLPDAKAELAEAR